MDGRHCLGVVFALASGCVVTEKHEGLFVLVWLCLFAGTDEEDTCLFLNGASAEVLGSYLKSSKCETGE